VAVLSLAEARDKARELRKVAKAGHDPIAARDKAKAVVPTFEAAAEACHEARRRGWSERHANAFLASLKRHAFPRLGRLMVNSVDEKDILAVLSPLWHPKPSAARKLRQQISTVLDFAKGHGWRPFGAPRESLRPLLANQGRPGNFSSMPYTDVPELFRRLRSKPVSMGRLALLFTIATACRSGEARLARWSHIDLSAKVWTRPAELMKMRESHVVTLSPVSIAILKKAREFRGICGSDLVFPGPRGRGLSDMSLLQLVKREAGPFTVHG
jgi:integrase